MAGWKETIKGKSGPIQKANGLSYTRRFVTYAGLPNSTSIPAFYDAHPDSSVCFVDGIQRRPLADGTQGEEEALIQYNTLGGDSQADDISTSFSALPRRVTTGGEFYTISTSTGEWYFNTVPRDRARADLQQKISTGTLEITEVIESSAYAADSSAGAFQRSIRYSGRINNATFEGLGAGNWLYDGANFDRFINSSGALRYKVHHSFSFRLPNFPTITTNGWRLIYRDDQKKWDYIQDTAGGGGNPIPYTEGSFSVIFTAPGI